jgi:hypothetical protein
MDAWKETLTSNQLDAWEDEVDDAKKKFLKKTLVPAARGGLRNLVTDFVVDTNTTAEWQQLTKEGFWGGAILGLAQSLPAMIGRSNPMGWVQRTSQMYAQVSDGLMQEMENDPAFAEISESEKAAIIAPIGVVSSVLEAYGLRNVLQSKGIITSITMAALGKAGRGVGNKSFRELVENEVTSRIAKGALVITAAGLAEGETGAAQEISETGFKAVYNMIKGDEYFQNPKTVEEFVKDVAIAGAQEAVGGFVLGVPNAVGAAYSKKGFLKMDDATFEAFENMANDGSLQSAYIISLKEKIASGKISASDAKEELQNYRTAVGVYRQIPDGLTLEQKKEAMNLLKERKDLEQFIDGKDAALVSRQKNRITELNDELSKISEQGGIQKIQSEADDVIAQREAKIAELSKAIEEDDTATELNLTTKLPTEERQKIELQLQELKEQKDAIQEQAAGEVPVQSGATVSQEVAQGEGTLEGELRAALPYEFYENNLSSELEWQRESAKEFLDDPKAFFEKNIEMAKQNLEADPNNKIAQNVLADNTEKLRVFNEITNKYKQDAVQKQAEPQVTAEAGVQEEVTAEPTTLTQEQQLASMEQMFAEEEAPQTATTDLGVSVTNRSAIDDKKTKTTDKERVKVIEAAQRVLTTLKSVLPNFDIILHDDDGSFNAAMDTVRGKKDTRGNFFINEDGSGRIDINLSRANNRTVAHEVAHAVMAKAFNGTPEVYKSFRDKISKVLNESTNKKLMEFSSNYKQDVTYEEYLAELTAILEQEESSLSVNTLQKIAAIINNVVSKLTNGTFKPFQDIKETNDLIEFFNSTSTSIRLGEEIELNGGGEVGTFNFGSKSSLDVKDAPSAANDSRSFIKDLVQDVDIRDFSGKKFVTNMYDYTNAGVTDLGNGFSINMLGGKNYVPYMMSLQGKKIGDVSNLAAFNSKAQAESFARNATQGEASLFAPHSGTLSQSWQFQQHTFAELVNLIVDKNIMTGAELIDVFNKTIASNIDNKDAFDAFKTKYGKDISNFDSFKDNPKQIVDLLDIKNNYSPDLRKALNNAISADKTFQKAIGIKNKEEFFQKIMDPLNNGVKGGEIINVVEFDPKTFQIVQTKAGSLDHHPSFGWAILSKINGIYQPTQFYQSSSVTESYVKYNKSGEQVSRKADESNFEKKNVSSSAGSIPKVAEFTPTEPIGQGISKSQLDSDSKAKKVVQQARAQGFAEEAIKLFLQSKGLTEEAINIAMGKDIPAAGRITLSEETLSGYDTLMKRLENLIVKGMPLAEVIIKLKNSKAYKNSTDIQKEKLVREVRKMGGAKEKSAPRAGRLIGIINDITKITMTEKEVLNKRIKDKAEGAKDAVKAWRKITSDLAKEIKALAKDKSGKLTARQVTRVTTRLAKLNAFNEQSVKDFIEYMAKVFADAEYRDTIDGLRGKIAKAKNNIASKIGIANTLRGSLNKLLSINPLLIPDSLLGRYAEIVDMLGANQQVLKLEQYDVVKRDTDTILKAVDEEQSKAYELADVFENSENKVFVKGVLDYAATLKEMVKRGEITEEQANLMRKYKKEIVTQDEKQKLSEEEIKQKKEDEIKAIETAEIKGIAELPSIEERQFAQKFAELLKSVSAETLMKLSLNDLKNLSKIIDNINNNYLPSYAYQVYLKIDGIRDEAVLDDASSKATPPIVSTAIARIKNLITKDGALLEAIKRIPLFNIDQVLGNFKGKEVFNALLLKTAQAEAKYKSELKRINSLLEKAEQKVADSFSLNQRKITLSKMKMMTYMRQLEYESNEGNEQVNPAIEYLNKTIEHIEKEKGNKIYGKEDLKDLKYIRDEFKTDGQINLKKLYDSFNQAEKDAVNDIKKINESLRSKAEFTSNVIRGKVFDGLDNYLHLIVLGDDKNADIQAATDVTNRANSNMNPSTKAKSLEKRTKGAKPISFDVFASASRGAKYVLLDYNLTAPIRTARIALNQLEKTLDERKNVTKLQREVANALRKAYNEAVDNLLINNIMDETAADEFVNYVSRMGYRSVLAGTGRFAAELTSNVSFAILAEPQSFIKGTKYANIIMSPLGPLVLENISSTQTNRIFPEDSLSGNFMDTSAMGQRVGMGSKSKGPIVNKIQQLWNLSGKKYTNGVEALADNMISTPDKIVMRALWFGSFANEFKKASGKDVDFKLIGENNEAYLKENKDAIDKARATADQTSVQAGATDNSFMGILKGVSRPNQSTMTKAYNNFNNYMTRFLIFEFMSARTGIHAMVGDGPMSRTKGAMLLAAVATRMTVYSMLSRTLADGIIGVAAPLFGIEDEEEKEVEKSFLQSVGQAITGTVGSLFFGRDFGNTVKMVTNLGLEYFNEEYLDFLREGEYDQYEDAIAYSIIPRSKEDKSTLDDFLFRLGGSFGPGLQTGKLIGENLLSGSIQSVISGGTTKKEADAIEREKRVVTERIPLEVLGNLGFVPLYKDIRRAVNKSIYSSIRKGEAKVKDFADIKEKSKKIKDLRALKEFTTDEGELRAIRRKMLQVNGTPEQKESVKNYNKIKEDRRKRLLYDSENSVRYDNETELKRYNPRLYKENFGVGSEWDEKYKAEEAVESKLSKVTRKREDEEFGYKKKD